ncbi:hypothetical protein J1N35_003539 [Gossypium stocksii]|uniref:Major facilitator superfamily (MFS) profile domain-containing protein n=1 Tax=Gossypium stocksii TaxID=47602 RepID=A0A9D4AGV5_9ROSI|nr:hypothetical protein J1N35_003539 [Gossypium stocksii]
MGFSVNYAFLMVGRFVAGIGVGFALTSAVLYTAEISPASSRGFLASFPEVCINSGILLGYVSNYAFSKLPIKIGWRLMLGVGAIPSIFLAFAVLAMPESPRWLVLQGRLDEAKVVLDKTLDTKEEAQLRLDDIKEAAKIPQDSTTGNIIPKQTNGEGSSGIAAVVLYSPRIFEKAGITSSDGKLLATIAIGFSKTIFVLVATLLLDKIGRRVLLLSSVGRHGSVASDTRVFPNDRRPFGDKTNVGHCLVYDDGFSFRLIFCDRNGADNQCLHVGDLSFEATCTRAITIGGAFFLFAGIATIGWVFFYVCMPETRGKTLEEIECLFGKLVGWKEASKKMNDVAIEG